MLIWELLGAIIGAGFASGREIASFFAQYHVWGYAGAILAACLIVWLANTEMPPTWKNHWPELACKTLITLMLLATGGAMLSGAGEIAAMTLPFKQAYWIGAILTLAMAWLMAHRTLNGLAWVSKSMLLVFALLLFVAMFLPGDHTVVVAKAAPLRALVQSACYSGFNAALLIPFLQRESFPDKRITLMTTGAVLSVLLLAGNIIFHLHPMILYEPMPFISLTNHLGKAGFYLSGICLYMAVLSTLTACLRGLGKRLISVIGITGVALLGFHQVVEQAYTYIGGACFVMFLAAKFRNCSGKAFIS